MTRLFTDLLGSEGFVTGLVVLGALGVLGMLMRAGGMPHRGRVLGMTAAGLGCMLSACSTPTKGGRGTVKGTAKERYIQTVRGEVQKKWRIYSMLRRDGVTYGKLQVDFYVNKQGKVEGLQIVNDKESNPILTGFTLQAIKDAEIPPMPADVIPSLPMNDPERLKIHYDVLIY